MSAAQAVASGRCSPLLPIARMQTAKVAIIRLLADLQPFSRDGECPVCKERETNAEQVEAKLLDLLSRQDAADKHERERKRRQVVREEPAAFAEHAPTEAVAQVE
jgi:transcriptional regulator NrdR family protein